jgi:hypothetical protein
MSSKDNNATNKEHQTQHVNTAQEGELIERGAHEPLTMADQTM